jgi:hypothetical protein
MVPSVPVKAWHWNKDAPAEAVEVVRPQPTSPTTTCGFWMLTDELGLAEMYAYTGVVPPVPDPRARVVASIRMFVMRYVTVVVGGSTGTPRNVTVFGPGVVAPKYPWKTLYSPGVFSGDPGGVVPKSTHASAGFSGVVQTF